MMNAKFSLQMLWPRHENKLIIQTPQPYTYASFKSATLYFGFRLIVVCPNQQVKVSLFETQMTNKLKTTTTRNPI